MDMHKRYIFDEPDDVSILDTVMENDIHKKYKVKCSVTGEMIMTTLPATKKKGIAQYETYEQYLEKMKDINNSNYQWIYNIIDGKAEQDSIIFSDEQIIVIPTFTWNKSDMKKFHILTIVKDKRLRSIRDLTEDDIPLLMHAMTKTLDVINSVYNMTRNDVKIYIHYLPSTWQLHIHFVNVTNTDCDSSVEYSHELSIVIYNLTICPDYYKKCNMLIYE